MVNGLLDYVSSFLSTEGSNDVRPISTQEAEIICNNRRRAVLKILSHSDRPELAVGDLATMITEWENGRDYDYRDRQTVYSNLNGTHLPKLDDAEFIDYDTDGRSEVRKNDSIEELADYIEHYPHKDSLFPSAREIHLEMDEDELLTRDDGFHVLSNDRRRFVLKYMDEHETEEFDFQDLYQNLASFETDIPVEELSYPDYNRHSTNLRQIHLPKLDELSVVDFDKEEKTVSKDVYFDPLTPYLPDNL